MFLLYFIIWVIFNGRLTLEVAVIGLIVSAAVFAFTCKFMDYSIKKEIALLKRIPMLLVFVVTLLKEILKANVVTTKLILSGHEEPVPVLVDFEEKYDKELDRTLLANAITLTPGTITAFMETDDEGVTHYRVHCLDESFAPGMADSDFVHMLHDMEENEKL